MIVPSCGRRLRRPRARLRRQQPFAAQQPQDPFAADPDPMLATQPGPDLAVASPANGESAST
jgi:hypothetical protein